MKYFTLRNGLILSTAAYLSLSCARPAIFNPRTSQLQPKTSREIAQRASQKSNSTVLAESICIETATGCFQILAAGVPLPNSFSTTFSNRDHGQDTIGIFLYQGTSEIAMENRQVGTFELPINSSAQGEAAIQVTIEVNSDKKLTVIVQDLKTGTNREFAGTGFVQ